MAPQVLHASRCHAPNRKQEDNKGVRSAWYAYTSIKCALEYCIVVLRYVRFSIHVETSSITFSFISPSWKELIWIRQFNIASMTFAHFKVAFMEVPEISNELLIRCYYLFHKLFRSFGPRDLQSGQHRKQSALPFRQAELQV